MPDDNALTTSTPETDSQWVSVTAPARLHFGLLELCPGEEHQFGGIGLMLESPATQLRVQHAVTNSGNGQDWYLRVQKAATKTVERLGLHHHNLDWHLDASPGQHVGLGSGTQLAAAAASLTLAFSNRDHTPQSRVNAFSPSQQTILASVLWQSTSGDLDSEQLLAESTSRGNRSNIGLHGFLHGGFIVDYGRCNASEVPDQKECSRKTAHYYVPAEWRVVLVTPHSSEPIFGQREADWIQDCGRVPNPDKKHMLGLIEDSIVPNLNPRGFAEASQSLFEYSVLAGNLFSPIQHGTYRDQTTADIVSAIRMLGVTATGQSSWGPTVFALLENVDQANWLIDKLQSRLGDEKFATQIACLNRQGAILSRSNQIALTK